LRDDKGRCGTLPWYQAGNLRVRGLNPSGSRQPLTPGNQKMTNNTQPSVPLMKKKSEGVFEKIKKVLLFP